MYDTASLLPLLVADRRIAVINYAYLLELGRDYGAIRFRRISAGRRRIIRRSRMVINHGARGDL